VQTTSCGASEADLFYPLLSLNIFLLCLLSPVLTITMSFGFSFGDFVAVLQLANNIRKQFVDAPSQFKAISGE
jgi:hypothetical protein